MVTDSSPKLIVVKVMAEENGCSYIREFHIGYTLGVNGISEVSHEAPSDNKYYDLTGRRVSSPTHGIYIQNGKKIVIK